MALLLNESKISLNHKFGEMLFDLQGNILKHHGRTFAFHIFLSIKNGMEQECKNWISEFAVSKITNAAKQLIDAKNKNKKDIDGGTFYNLSLSASGYHRLNIPSVQIPTDPAFVSGLKTRNAVLNDNTNNWENEFKNGIDVLIIVSNTDDKMATQRKDDVLSQINLLFNTVKIQKGEVLKNVNGIGIEHFGYTDGISQPIFLEDEVVEQDLSGSTNWSDKATLDLALVKDNGGKFQDSFGSYLVFRKLEQNVKAFDTAENKLPKVKDVNGNKNDELAGAMIVGRFEDGTEVTNNSVDRGITLPSQLNNDFNYSNDTAGSKCPFHAHIRIANPRNDVGAFAKTVRLVRRGIPFNEIKRKGTKGKPTKGVGLLFMCYQASIVNQFEFIQSTWVNHGEIGPGNFVGQDGLIGQNSPQNINVFPKSLPDKWGNTQKKNPADFSNPKSGFVTMKGGEYFFTPSISFLRSLGL